MSNRQEKMVDRRAFVLMENRDILKGTYETPLHDNFARSSGLEREQIDDQKQKNSRTSLDVGTFSKGRKISKKAGSWMTERNVQIISSILVSVFVLTVLLFLMGRALFTDYLSEQNVFERRFPKRFVKEYLREALEEFHEQKVKKYIRESLEEFYERKGLGTAACNCKNKF